MVSKLINIIFLFLLIIISSNCIKLSNSIQDNLNAVKESALSTKETTLDETSREHFYTSEKKLI